MEQQIDFKRLDKNLRRQMVIDTATHLFHLKGYRTATLDDLAHALGLSKPALYHYFSSKEELLSLIYIQALENFFAKAYEIGEMDLAPREKLRFFIRNHIQSIIIGNLPMFAVFFSEENQLPEKQFRKIREEKRKYSEVVEKIIAEGIREGSFREVNPKLQAFALIGMCNWLYKWYNFERRGYTPEEIADHFIDFLENGYLRPSHRPGQDRESVEGDNPLIRIDKKRRVLEELKEKNMEMSDLLEAMDKYF